MLIGETEVRIVRGDISLLDVDAVVIAPAEEEIKKSGRCVKKAIMPAPEGSSARYLIRAVTLVKNRGREELNVRKSCKYVLETAKKHNLASIALPALGCEKGAFLARASAKIMAQEILRHIKEERTTLKKIVVCLKDPSTYAVFQKNCLNYLDYMVNELKSPFVTVDAIIELGKGKIVLIERSNPPFGWALPGGFVDYGESLEEAVIREAKEETGLRLTHLKQFHTYSDPKRDPRFHTIGTVFTARAKGIPKAGDDAAGVKVVPLSEIKKLSFAFDHKQIIEDYNRGTSDF